MKEDMISILDKIVKALPEEYDNVDYFYNTTRRKHFLTFRKMESKDLAALLKERGKTVRVSDAGRAHTIPISVLNKVITLLGVAESRVSLETYWAAPDVEHRDERPRGKVHVALTWTTPREEEIVLCG
jgi:hypothetical protein